MFKRLLFFIVLFIPIVVNASLIKDLKVLNGVISREFQSTNNYYSVDLDDGSDELELDYELVDGVTLDINIDNDKEVLTVSKDNMHEDYVFYLNKSVEELPVFQENEEEDRQIPHLKIIVFLGGLAVILMLFKLIVLGRKKD